MVPTNVEVENYKKWQRVLWLQCICLLGSQGIWKHTKQRLNKLEKSIKQMPMVDEDYFYFNL